MNRQNKGGWTPLMYAAHHGNLEVVFFLLQEGAVTSTKNTLGLTALMLASKSGSVDVVNLLINFGASVNERDQNGWTALFYAADFGHRSIVQLLVKKGADVNLCEYSAHLTPLMVAVSEGHEDIVKDLLYFDANPASVSKDGETPSGIALKYGFFELRNLIDAYLHLGNNHVRRIDCTNLRTFLQSLQLSKYYQNFEICDINMNSFWKLTNEDLINIGIVLLGPRKKMLKYINLHRNQALNINPEDAAYNQIVSENKKLRDELSKEKELRAAAEKSANEGIQALRAFTCGMKRNLCCTHLAQEQIRKNICLAKGILDSNPARPRMGRNFETDSLYLVLEGMEKFVDAIQNQTVSTLRQINAGVDCETDFTSLFNSNSGV